MKTKLVISLTVLFVAVVSLVVHYRREVWLSIAYDRFGDGCKELVFYQKRACWLPGVGTFVPDQACITCRKHAHWQCKDDAKGMNLEVAVVTMYRVAEDHKLPVALLRAAKCTCPNFYHDDG